MVYKACDTTCPNTCDSGTANADCREDCVEGCFCPDGMVMQEGECVQREQCSCENGGMLYSQSEYLFISACDIR